jgi:hypothetical protein
VEGQDFGVTGMARWHLQAVQHPVANDHAQDGYHSGQPAWCANVDTRNNDEAFKQRDQGEADVVGVAGQPVVALQHQDGAGPNAAKEHVQTQTKKPGKDPLL